MKKWILPVLLLCVFIVENVFSTIVPIGLFGGKNIAVPHFTFIVLMLIAIYYNPTKSIYFGIVFGLLFDVVYTEIVGVYLFIFPVMAYGIAKAIKMLEINVFIVCTLIVFAITIIEYCVYGMYALIGFHMFSHHAFVTERLVPTLLLNAIFLFVFYYPLKKYLTRLLEIIEEK